MSMNTGPSIYIYSEMNPTASFKILIEAANELENLKDIKENRTPVWLVRLSRKTGMGYFTVDYIIWCDTKESWKKNSTRFALSAQGWILVNDLKDKDKHLEKLIEGINLSEEQEQSLYQFLFGLKNKTTKQRIGFDLAYRINPLLEETISYVDNLEKVTANLDFEMSQTNNILKSSTDITLTVDMNQALTREFTLKTSQNSEEKESNLDDDDICSRYTTLNLN